MHIYLRVVAKYSYPNLATNGNGSFFTIIWGHAIFQDNFSNTLLFYPLLMSVFLASRMSWNDAMP